VDRGLWLPNAQQLRLSRLLAAGGMGLVVLARHEVLDQQGVPYNQ
jgi:hypothetical protein